MIAIPLIYFSLFAYFLYLRNGRTINLPVYILLIYAVSGFFSIMMDIFDLRSIDTAKYQFSIKASFVYCLCITLAVLPLIGKVGQQTNLRPIGINNSVIKFFAVLSVLFFMFYAIMSIPDMLRTLTGDMAEMRSQQYWGIGEDLWYAKINPAVRFPIILLKFFLGVPWIMIFMAFYVRVVQKLPAKYALMFLLTSLIGPIDGIMGVDRSKVAYWIISLLGVFIFFRPYLSEKQRKSYVRYGYVLVAILSVYLALMTISRFGVDADSSSMDGSSGSLIAYFGMPYVNFCFFFDNFELKILNPTTVFPFISQYLIMGGLGTGTEFQAFLSMTTNYDFGVLYTYLGAIYIALGELALYAYVLIMFFLASLILRKRKDRTISIHYSYSYLLFSSIPMLGLFTHYYSYATATFGAVSFFILTTLFPSKKIKETK